MRGLTARGLSSKVMWTRQQLAIPFKVTPYRYHEARDNPETDDCNATMQGHPIGEFYHHEFILYACGGCTEAMYHLQACRISKLALSSKGAAPIYI